MDRLSSTKPPRMGGKIKETGKRMVKPKLRKRQGRERRKGHRARHMMRVK